MDNANLIAALWVGLALAASLLSIRLGISVALLEIGIGVIAGNTIGIQSNPWIDFLASFGAVLLTFLAGAEIDPASSRRHLRASLVIGGVSFVAPFLLAFGVAYVVLGWRLASAEIAGLALSTTSVAVVYAVMIESGLATRELGKLILAACFVTDLGTVLFLGILFADFDPRLVAFAAVTILAIFAAPRLLSTLVRRVPGRVSEPEIKLVFFILLGLGGLAQVAGSESVLPAYLLGLAVAGTFASDRVLVNRMRATAFSLLTPFYFLRAGSLVSVPAIVAGLGLIVLFLALKLGSKVVGVWPIARAFGLRTRDATYTTLLMSTGLTFGTIAALFGYTNGFIDQATYTILVTVVILSAVVPTLIATTFFQPELPTADALEDFEAAEEIDAGPLERGRASA
ncbi:MAG TPA: cation:proton antiporter [Candidatus Limnocylindrales bacterium]|nr:cation:proton antiporter [Candidatus Limnocylindrales bacterium]